MRRTLAGSGELGSYEHSGFGIDSLAVGGSLVRRDGYQYYAWQASRCRELASRQPSADVKAHLDGVAGRYDELARIADVQSDRPELRRARANGRQIRL